MNATEAEKCGFVAAVFPADSLRYVNKYINIKRTNIYVVHTTQLHTQTHIYNVFTYTHTLAQTLVCACAQVDNMIMVDLARSK